MKNDFSDPFPDIIYTSNHHISEVKSHSEEANLVETRKKEQGGTNSFAFSTLTCGHVDT